MSTFKIAAFALFIPVKPSCAEQWRREGRGDTMMVMVKEVMMVIKKREEELQAQILRKVIN